MTEAVFRAKAPGIMRLLMQDFPLDLLDVAAIMGNLGHESGGLTEFQEKVPTVKGSRGGWGWAQWTGPRRREFEAYCSRNGFDLKSDKANYGWLFVELRTTERRAIPAVKSANGLDAKVRAFEVAFQRAGVKHYPSRNIWAQRALDAYRTAEAKGPIPLPAFVLGEQQPLPPVVHPPAEPDPDPTPPPTKPIYKSGEIIGALVVLFAVLAQLIGYELAEEDRQALSETLTELWPQIAAIGGAILVIVRRMKRTSRANVTLTGKD
jgi:hypothetical protein